MKIGLSAFAATFVALFLVSFTTSAQERSISKGEVLFFASGCGNCHTDVKNKGPFLAGGRKFKTPFGTFYSPNITRDKKHGIGAWSDADFIKAVRKGRAPDGSHYFPVFPYPAYTFMTDADLIAIKNYIFTLPALSQPNKPHGVSFPFNIRFGQFFWKWLYFSEGPYKTDPAKSKEWNRGAYLSRAVVHCGECHTPRTILGGIKKDYWYAGTAEGEGPEGQGAPNITPHIEKGIGKWSLGELVNYLESGEDPTGDYAGSLMAEVIENGTGKLSAADRKAIAVYLKSLKPLP
ncbi:MAG: c-type cytochrome [Alphaproteobacteria bacterium]